MRVDGARYAVDDLDVELGQDVLLVHGGLGDVTNRGRLDHVADGEPAQRKQTGPERVRLLYSAPQLQLTATHRLMALSLGTHRLQFEHRRKELWPAGSVPASQHPFCTRSLAAILPNSPRPFRLRPSAAEKKLDQQTGYGESDGSIDELLRRFTVMVCLLGESGFARSRLGEVGLQFAVGSPIFNFQRGRKQSFQKI